MRGLLVVNPRATTTSPRVIDVIVSAFSADIDMDVTVTTHRGHGIALGERARAEGMDVVVTLGGDGVVNEVTNGMLADGLGPDVPMLAPVPGGSANVFARSLGIPNDAVEATGVILESLREGTHRSIGLGRADGRWFLANAGLGIDAEIIAAMEGHRAAGRAATPLRYLSTTLAAYFRHTDRRHPALCLNRPDPRAGGGHQEVPGVFFAFVQNTSPWTFLGTVPVNPCPEASFETGLDVFGVRRLHVPAATVVAARMLRGPRAKRAERPDKGPRAKRAEQDREQPRRRWGRWDARNALVTWHDVDTFTVTADHPVAAQIDGEGIGLTSSLTFSAHPDALRVVC